MKKIIALALAALLALTMVSALAAEYNDKGTVKQVQQALNDAGFNCGTPDGAAGKKTKQAIMDFQAENGLEQTGVIDDALLAALGVTPDENAPRIEPITFQGIPWGSTPEEVEKALVESGMIEEGSFVYVDGQTQVWPENTDNYEGDFYTEINHLIHQGGYAEPQCLKTIAGLDIIDMKLFFITGIVDGAIDDTPRLTMVWLTPGSFSYGSEKSDLELALDAAYGDSMRNSYGVVWTGAEQSAVCVSYMYGGLIYARTGDYKVVRELQALEGQEAPVKEDAGV